MIGRIANPSSNKKPYLASAHFSTRRASSRKRTSWSKNTALAPRPPPTMFNPPSCANCSITWSTPCSTARLPNRKQKPSRWCNYPRRRAESITAGLQPPVCSRRWAVDRHSGYPYFGSIMPERGPELESLFALFPPAQDIGNFQEIPGDEIPPLYHGLLVHEHHM